VSCLVRRIRTRAEIVGQFAAKCAAVVLLLVA
jgi:hypothetical protein